MNAFFKDLREDKLLGQGFVFNFIIILISLLYIFLYFRNLPPFIPIFNQMPWGEQRIAKTIWIFILPFLSFLILIINLTLSSMFYKKNPLIARLFSITSFLVSVLTFLFIVRTIHTVL